MTETKTSREKDGDFDKAIIDMEEALLGVAKQEESILISIKNNLDQMLDKIYTQMKEYQHVATMDAMISEIPMTQADPALIAGLGRISSDLNHKNIEISKLQLLQEALGVGVAISSNQSMEMIRQQLDELNKRNKILRDIHQQIIKHPMITGQTKGIKLSEIKIMLEKLNDQIQTLNKTNFTLKQQIKPQQHDLNQKAEQKEEPTTPRRRPSS